MVDPARDSGRRWLLGTDLEPALDRWLAEATTDDAARRRSAARWLRQQAEEEGTFEGLLADLGEQGTAVVVHTRGGRSYAGRIEAVGNDFLVLSVPGAGDVWIAFRAVGSVRVPPGEPMPVGDHAVRSASSLAEMVVRLAGERERATFVPLDGAGPVCGLVRAVGQDVVTIGLDGDRTSVAGYVCLPLDAIGEVIPRVW